LARHFGVDEHQAMRVYPAWYMDVLLDGLRTDMQAGVDGGVTLSGAPDTLDEWR
jgi:hypothetical protein